MSGELQYTYWNHVACHWHYYGSPLRPCKEDIGFLEDAVLKRVSRRPRLTLRAVLWGVTPEIANMTWPGGTQLAAVDSSEEMIQVVWPGDIVGFRRAYCGNWLDSDRITGGSAVVVIGDGCLTNADYPDGYRDLVAAAHRVLTDKGVLIMRFFVQPPIREAPDHVIRELCADRIRNFFAFKFRLAMALQKDVRSGVRRHDIWQRWVDAGIDTGELMSMTGWREELINTMALYNGKDTRLSFPTLRELRMILSDYFVERALTVPKYEMGERCPIMVFEKRSGDIHHK